MRSSSFPTVATTQSRSSLSHPLFSDSLLLASLQSGLLFLDFSDWYGRRGRSAGARFKAANEGYYCFSRGLPECESAHGAVSGPRLPEQFRFEQVAQAPEISARIEYGRDAEEDHSAEA